MENKSNESQSVHVTFTIQRETCPPFHINNIHLPQQEDVKNFGLHLNRRLTWSKHIFAKWKHPRMMFIKMYWLLGQKSKLSTSNKSLIYKAILKPIWTCETQLWGTASTSNIEILEHFHSKFFHKIVDAPCYMLNTVIETDHQTPTIKKGRSLY
jgi:hypothetical protein